MVFSLTFFVTFSNLPAVQFSCAYLKLKVDKLLATTLRY